MYPYFSNNKNNNELTIKAIKINESSMPNNSENGNKNNSHNNDNLSNTDEVEFNKYILDMLKEAIKDEYKDMTYYEKLSKVTQDQSDSDLIRKIHLDEMKHYQMLMDLYKLLTGEEAKVELEEGEVEEDLLEEFKDRIEEELDTVEFYRTLLALFLDIRIRDMFFELLTDEQAHAQKMNFLYTKHK